MYIDPSDHLHQYVFGHTVKSWMRVLICQVQGKLFDHEAARLSIQTLASVNARVKTSSCFSYKVGVVRPHASGIYCAHKTPSFMHPLRLRKRSSGCSMPISYSCPFSVVEF